MDGLPPDAQFSAPARDLPKLLAPYRVADHRRSIFELAITGVPYLALWLAAWIALSISIWLTLALAVPAGAFLTRLFIIQHDCGHGAFFRRRKINDWVGRVLGVLTQTPYYVWRRSHAVHHATSGNLAKRGVGDINILTVREYLALPRYRQFHYRVYRHPITIFALAPAYIFLLRNRVPPGISHASWRFWVSAMGTNAALAVVAGTVMYAIGVREFLLVQVPITLVAGSIGVWLFYVQHQFEATFWVEGHAWRSQDAALRGSSHYDLPPVLRWMTANIGVHHVHHLSSRIPFYRLGEVLRDVPELTQGKHITLGQSFACVKYRLWDEGRQKLVSFAEARAQPAQ
ncbi:MAG: fatty acid desaturase [Alphaproteobacteria bacterium]|nr:fatty acid desaturase [Alphaproteobacteria bacterium]